MTPAPLQLGQAPSELALNSAGFTPLAFANALRIGSSSPEYVAGLLRREPRIAPGRPTLRPGPAPSRGSVKLSPQLTAFFTSAPIFFSSAAVSPFSAKEVGHMAPSSRFALSLKPNVAYLVLNFCALWKKQTTLPSFAYAGIPYQVLGERAGALALMMAWSRSAMARSGSGISAIFASTSLSPSTLPARGPRRAAAFSSWARSLIAARSSSVNPLDALPVTVALLADFCVSVFGLIELPILTLVCHLAAVRMEFYHRRRAPSASGAV